MPSDVFQQAHDALRRPISQADEERWRLAMPEILPAQVANAVCAALRWGRSGAEVTETVNTLVTLALVVGCPEADVRRWVAEGERQGHASAARGDA